MRMEAKVYLSHTDMARVVEAAKRSGRSLSGYLRSAALVEADRLLVGPYPDVLQGQRSFAEVVAAYEAETGRSPWEEPVIALVRASTKEGGH